MGNESPSSRATADRAGRLLLVVVLVAALFLAAVPAFAGEKPLPLDTERVTLCGLTYVKEMRVPEEKPRRPWVLELDRPVLVGGNEFGKQSREKVMQIVFKSDINDPDSNATFRKLLDDYTGKRACITGELYRRMTANHMTDVLIILRKIELEKRKPD